MVFNSYIFIFTFLPIALTGFYLLGIFFPKKIELRIIFLLSMSLWFYAYFKLAYILILGISLFFNYTIAYIIENTDQKNLSRKSLLYLGLLFNILLLGFFKYTNFLLNNFNIISSTSFHFKTIILPLGISFFTFQQISFLVDIYKKEVQLKNFFKYSFFVCFFPQFVAGPIVRYKEIMPQLNEKSSLVNWDNLNKGIFLFTSGLFKKLVIADLLANAVGKAFDPEGLASLSSLDAWMGSLSYTLQIYFDFSGYCDMAMGLAYLFNIRLPFNFLSPYKSKNINEFWQTWHITLGRFLRDYIYIPLGGNRGTPYMREKNILIVFLISGIWHGAAWTFVIWGLLHGIASVVHSLWRKYNKPLPSLLAWGITFFFINLTWVFFRSPSLSFAFDYLKRMLSPNRWSEIFSSNQPIISQILSPMPTPLVFINPSVSYSLGLLIILIFCILSINQKQYMEKYLYKFFSLILVFFFLVSSMFLLHKPSPFLYFNF